jgi:hypothetical protein
MAERPLIVDIGKNGVIFCEDSFKAVSSEQ